MDIEDRWKKVEPVYAGASPGLVELAKQAFYTGALSFVETISAIEVADATTDEKADRFNQARNEVFDFFLEKAKLKLATDQGGDNGTED